MTKTQLEAIKKPNQIITQFERVDNGVNEQGFMTYRIIYVEPPKSYKLIHIDDESKLAVLEDLDYEEKV